MEVRSPHLGLRDFLFYLVPGSIVLMSVLGASGVSATSVGEWGNLGGSLLGVLVSYAVGQAIYPLVYPIRRIWQPDGEWLAHSEEFRDAQIKLITSSAVFYTSVVFRDRSFARFSSAMVIPCLAAGAAAVRLAWNSSALLACVYGALGAFAACGFVYRFRHYDRRYRSFVWRSR